MGATALMRPEETGLSLLEATMSDLWVYILGEVSGRDVKIGKTTGRTVTGRIREVNAQQTTAEEYVLLCAVRGSAKDEAELIGRFADLRRRDKGRQTEYFWPEDELVEYVHWLRAQWWAVVEASVSLEEAEPVDPSHWLPNGRARRLARPVAEEGKIVQDFEMLTGDLAGTAWNWLPDPRPSIQDYYTPPEIVQAAREAMGGIDLDAASHWLANRTLRIPDYFTIGRSAFENEWHGRVWLNPPYGNNAPWFDRILEFVDSGAVTQLCMLSPVHVFNTGIAKPLMDRVAGMVLLSPSPQFWGHSDGRTGTNLPHAVVYIGERPAAFFRAFASFGIPFAIPALEAVA